MEPHVVRTIGSISNVIGVALLITARRGGFRRRDRVTGDTSAPHERLLMILAAGFIGVGATLVVVAIATG